MGILKELLRDFKGILKEMLPGQRSLINLIVWWHRFTRRSPALNPWDFFLRGLTQVKGLELGFLTFFVLFTSCQMKKV